MELVSGHLKGLVLEYMQKNLWKTVKELCLIEMEFQ